MNAKLIARMFRKMADDITPMFGTGYEVTKAQKVTYNAVATVFEADLLASGEVNCLGCLHGRPMVTQPTAAEANTDERRAFAEKWWKDNEGKHCTSKYSPDNLCPNYKRPEEEK